MLNTEMKIELTGMIANSLRLNQDTLDELLYDDAVVLASQIAVDIFADYVDFDDDEIDSITETLHILADDEAMLAIAEAEAEIEEGYCDSCNYRFDEEEGCDDCAVNLDSFTDDGSVVWYDSAEAAIAANE